MMLERIPGLNKAYDVEAVLDFFISLSTTLLLPVYFTARSGLASYFTRVLDSYFIVIACHKASENSVVLK
jgi:hypothetical protein